MATVIGDLLVVIRGDAKPLQASLAGAQASTSKFSGVVSKFGGVAPIAFASAGAAVIKFGADSVAAAAEVETVMAQTNAVIKSTGGAAGVTAGQVQEMAAAFQEATTFEDEAVQSAQNLLLTFTKIGADTLPDATQAVLDMSTALGQDLKSSSIQLGKALQNPTIGLTALRRVGISFTDSQVELIKSLDATGRSAEAQAIILAEVNKEFGGSAAARVDTYAGQIEQLSNAIDDLQEGIGGDLIPTLRGGVEFLTSVVEAADKATDAIGRFVDKIPGSDIFEGAPNPFNPAEVLGGAENLAGNITDFFGITEQAGSNAQEAAEIAAMETGLAWENGIGRALDAVQGYGDIPGVVDNANEEVEASLQALEDEFASTFLAIDGAEDVFGGTVNDFIQDADRMADQAVRAARNMAVLSHLPIPAEFMAWLQTQGPGAIDKFVRANKAGQDKIIADWRRARDAANDYGKAADHAARTRIAHIKTSIDFRSLEMLESKLAGLDARYDLGLASANAMGPSSGGGGTPTRRKREASYLDRERFERDHAYSREYEGWR